MSTAQMQIHANAKRKELERKAKYQELVQLIASDGRVPEQSVYEQILLHAGKTEYDLVGPDGKSGDAGNAKGRIDLRSKVAEGARMQATMPAIEKQLTKAKAVRDAAEAKYNETIAPLRFKRDAINHAASVASNAKAELHRTAPDDFDGQQAELEHELNQCRIESDAASKHLREMDSRLSHECNPQDGSRLNAAEVARLSEYVQTAQARVDAASELSTSLVAQQESLVAEMQAA